MISIKDLCKFPCPFCKEKLHLYTVYSDILNYGCQNCNNDDNDDKDMRYLLMIRPYVEQLTINFKNNRYWLIFRSPEQTIKLTDNYEWDKDLIIHYNKPFDFTNFDEFVSSIYDRFMKILTFS